MDVLLLGTGAAGGWPSPFCTCASCTHVRSLGAGGARATSSALVDGTVLIDPGPDSLLAAGRHGADLAGVRLVLVTHGHWDHVHPPLLVARHWAGRSEPLTVAGPEDALAAYRDWIGPDDPVELVPLRPGERLSRAGYDVHALLAAHGDVLAGFGLLYDLTAPDGGTLLYATDTGPLPEPTLTAVAGRRYDVVLLDETYGDRPGPAGDHLGLDTFAAAAAELRRRGAVAGGTRLVAVHLGHSNPPPDELARRLAHWGAELLPDGARLDTGAAAGTAAVVAAGARAAAPRRVLLLGGARSGKSAEAERRLAAEPSVVYVAPGPAPGGDDPEWDARVAAHRARRPAGWATVETTDVATVLRDAGRGDPPLLVDCLTTWLAAVMDAAGCWDPAVPGEVAAKAVAAGVDELVTAWRRTDAHVVAVANLVGDGVVPATESGRRFRDEMGALTARLAADADEVWLVVAGLPQRLR